MDKQYLELFTLIAQSTANLAERVMEDHKENQEEKEYTTATTMRDDYLTLVEKLSNNTDDLNKADYARLLVGAIIVTQQIEAKIKNEEKALQGYKIDVIPKLDQINNATPEETHELAIKLFTTKIKSENET